MPMRHDRRRHNDEPLPIDLSLRLGTALLHAGLPRGCTKPRARVSAGQSVAWARRSRSACERHTGAVQRNIQRQRLESKA